MKTKWAGFLRYLVPILFLCLQWPFLNADPDLALTGSRGPWADEGQYTIQARNYVQFGDWTMDASDALLKTPLFSALQYINFSVCGISLFNARLIVVLIFLLCMLIALRNAGDFGKLSLWVIPIVCTQFYIFQYAHFSLAEVPAIACIWLSLAFFLKSDEAIPFRYKPLLLAYGFLLLAVLLKIQFAYLLFLAPLYSLLRYFLLKKNEKKELTRSPFFYSMAFSLGIVLLLWLLWLKPHSAVLDTVLHSQVSNRFLPLEQLNAAGLVIELMHNGRMMFFNEWHVTLYSALFFVALMCGAWLVVSNKVGRSFVIMYMLLLSWLLLEAHKLFMLHVPVRYLLSVYFAMGCMIALVFQALVGMQASDLLQKFILLPIALLVGIQLVNICISIQHRTYATKWLNAYVENAKIADGFVMGQWAPALTWQSKVKTLPYIDGLTDRLKKNQDCKLIVSEVGQEYELDAMLKLVADKPSIDSVTYANLGYWKLRFTWLK